MDLDTIKKEIDTLSEGEVQKMILQKLTQLHFLQVTANVQLKKTTNTAQGILFVIIAVVIISLISGLTLYDELSRSF